MNCTFNFLTFNAMPATLHKTQVTVGRTCQSALPSRQLIAHDLLVWCSSLFIGSWASSELATGIMDNRPHLFHNLPLTSQFLHETTVCPQKNPDIIDFNLEKIKQF